MAFAFAHLQSRSLRAATNLSRARAREHNSPLIHYHVALARSTYAVSVRISAPLRAFERDEKYIEWLLYTRSVLCACVRASSRICELCCACGAERRSPIPFPVSLFPAHAHSETNTQYTHTHQVRHRSQTRARQRNPALHVHPQ